MRDAAGMRRRRPSGKARDRQIEAAPEKMHRTAFATKPRSELLEHAIALHQHAPEYIGVFPIVSAVLFIFIKGDRVYDLVREFVYGYRQMQLIETLHHAAVKIGNRTRFQFNRPPLAIARLNAQLVIGEI